MSTAYQQALAYIHGFQNYELTAPETIPPGAWDLSRIAGLLARLGDPQRAYPSLHVAGTKGKGSTAALCAHVLIEAGYRTGLYVSPHLVDFTERIQIDRQPIPPDALVRLVEDVRPHADGIPLLTWFELLTALAFWHFAREKVDVAVVEVGLGGRLDATNVLKPIASVVTRIGIDHTTLLGDTLAEIAAEKAAIIKPGVPAVTGPQKPEALAVIEQAAQVAGSPLTRVLPDRGEPPDASVWRFRSAGGEDNAVMLRHADQQWTYPLGLAGRFQAENASVAVAALHAAREQGLAFTQAHVRRGLAAARWRGRFDVLNDAAPFLVVDCAHTPESAHVLADELGHLAAGPRWTLVFGCMADKDAAAMMQTLLATANRVILTQADHPRALQVGQLAEIVEALRPAVPIHSSHSVGEGLARALDDAPAGDRICVAGSLAVAGEAIVAWQQRRKSAAT